MSIAHLPDDHVVYVPGVGETTVGTLRGTPTEQTPNVDAERAATVSMYEDIATRNLDMAPWDSFVTASEIRAFHASRYTNGGTRHAST